MRRHQRPEQIALRSHDADLVVAYLDALGERAKVIPPIAASVEPHPLARGL
ncbi:hypothetical protein [Sphingomonas hankookensis]|uniref:hypothetical protein n=1 Tax=Sphingomonas hankookensis TaxID=563996 RepID=UPI001F5A422C|nr:hypothetical protein [Sphingomonas hankookensis]